MMVEYINFASRQPRNIPYIKTILQELILEKRNQDILENQLINNSQRNPDKLLFNDLLMWLYIQKRNYYGAFVQAKAIYNKLNKKGTAVMQVANIAYQNESYIDAIKFYNHVAVEIDDLRIKEKAEFFLFIKPTL